MDAQRVLRQISEIVARPKCEDWGTKVFSLCEHFWDALRTMEPDEVDASRHPETVIAFAAMLQDSDSFAIAMHAIPELRSAAQIESPGVYRSHILQRTLEMRNRETSISRASSQATFDSEDYRREKMMFLDEEMHRMSLFLQRSEHLTDQERILAQEWLAQCPKALLYAGENQGTRDQEHTEKAKLPEA